MLASEGHNVFSVIRNPDQKADIEALGGKPVIRSIEDSSVDDMAETMHETQASVVVWAAGAGGGDPSRTRAVDNEGAIRCMDAASKASIKRYITISAIDVRDRENKPEPEWYDDADRDRSNRVWTVIKPYMEVSITTRRRLTLLRYLADAVFICVKAKYAADRNLVTENGRRNLSYTILRPGGLSNDPGTGAISAGQVHLNRTISREDVASAVLQCLKQDQTIGLAIDCVGGETPIADAIAEVARGRVDAFEGRH